MKTLWQIKQALEKLSMGNIFTEKVAQMSWHIPSRFLNISLLLLESIVCILYLKTSWKRQFLHLVCTITLIKYYLYWVAMGDIYKFLIPQVFSHKNGSHLFWFPCCCFFTSSLYISDLRNLGKESFAMRL